MEFLVRIAVHWPAGTDDETMARLSAAEGIRGRELGEAGIIRAMWRVPGRLENVGVWAAPGPDEVHAAITSLPLWPFMDVQVEALATHYLAPHLPFTCGPNASRTTPAPQGDDAAS
jgi:muconolactone D-isomerase